MIKESLWKFNSLLSSFHNQKEGVPQASIISVTLQHENKEHYQVSESFLYQLQI